MKRFLLDRRNWIRAAVCGILGASLFYAARQGKEWASRELAPFYAFLDHLKATIPTDARVLVVAPDGEREHSQVLQLNTQLYPRVVYLLPPGATALGQAGEWIRAKRLTWAVSLGGPSYDPRQARVWRLSDDR